MELAVKAIHASRHDDFELRGDLSVFRASGASAVPMNRAWDGRPAGPIAAEVYCLWSETFLYFGFSCPYEKLSVDESAPLDQPRWGLWDLDIAEVLISPQAQPVDHYYEFEVAPSGHWLDLEVIFREGRPFYNWDRRLNAGVRCRIDAERKSWTAELKIPASALSGREQQVGDQWSLNLFRAEGSPDRRRYLALWPTFTPEPNFHIPARFNTMRLME